MNNIFGQPIEDLNSHRRPENQPISAPCTCSDKKGTLIRLYIAPRSTIEFLGLLEITSPSGMCLLVSSPLLAERGELNLLGILDELKKSGWKIEIVNE
jgi:hypothetical protein